MIAVLAGPIGTSVSWSQMRRGYAYFETINYTVVHKADETVVIEGVPHAASRLSYTADGSESPRNRTVWFDRSLLIQIKSVAKDPHNPVYNRAVTKIERVS